MSRLIDADKLIDKLKEYTRTNNCEFNGACRSIIEIVKQQPTAYNVDKVLENIKFRNFLTITNTGDEKLDFAYSKVANILANVVDIVKVGGIDET